MRHIYKVNDGERHYVSATNEQEALQLMAEFVGESVDQYVSENEPEVTMLCDDWPLRVWESDFDEEPVEKLAREWAVIESGIIASSAV